MKPDTWMLTNLRENLTLIRPRKEDYEYDAYVWYNTFFFEIRDKERFNSEVLYAPISSPNDMKVYYF